MNRYSVKWDYPDKDGNSNIVDEIVYAYTYNLTEGDLIFLDVVQHDEETTLVPIRAFANGVWLKVAMTQEINSGSESGFENNSA